VEGKDEAKRFPPNPPKPDALFGVNGPGVENPLMGEEVLEEAESDGVGEGEAGGDMSERSRPISSSGPAPLALKVIPEPGLTNGKRVSVPKPLAV